MLHNSRSLFVYYIGERDNLPKGMASHATCATPSQLQTCIGPPSSICTDCLAALAYNVYQIIIIVLKFNIVKGLYINLDPHHPLISCNYYSASLCNIQFNYTQFV